jgi:hypothetical protein
MFWIRAAAPPLPGRKYTSADKERAREERKDSHNANVNIIFLRTMSILF